MQARRYWDSDFEEVSRWAREGYATEYQRHQIPKTGFIVEGIAAFFMYATDSSVCFLENLIANKETERSLKDQAINLLIEVMFKEARDQGYRVAYATTDLPAVVFRGATHGATAKPHQFLISKNLTDPS